MEWIVLFAGKTERNSEIAEVMLKKGGSDERVVMYTGLPIEQVRVIRGKINH